MRKRILLVHSGNETFVKLDQVYLSQNFYVNMLHAAHPFPFKFWEYWQGLQRADLLFCWFASWNSFWAILISRIINKPSIVIVGGYDTANDPKSNYGHQRGGVMKYLSCWAMRSATKISSFSHFSRNEVERNTNIPKDHVQMIYLGVPDQLINHNTQKNDNLILTVGTVNWENLTRKGLESFVRSAKYLREFEFVLVGKWSDDSIHYLQSIASENVHFTGRLSDPELIEYYQKAYYYVQASSHEGFGLSVAESMLARCVPIVSIVGSLPEVVGECGVYLRNCEPATIAETIKNIPKDKHIGEKARQRVLTMFPPENRIAGLSTLIDDVLQSHMQDH